MKLFTTLVLAVLHAAAAFLILMVASWFIAACSVAGIGFNYMLPAVVIRALAILRIASGYFSMLVGHSQLLDSLARLRSTLFASLDNHVNVSRKDSLQALDHQSETVAAIWVAWVGQNAGMFTSLLLLIIGCWWLSPELTSVLTVFSLFYLCLYLVLLLTMLRKAKDLVKAKSDAQFALVQHIESAPIWHLLSDYQAYSPSLRTLRLQTARLQSLVRVASLLLFAGSMLSLCWILSFYANKFAGNAVFLIVPIALLSVSDWLTPSLASQRQLIDYFDAKEGLDKCAHDTSSLNVLSNDIHSIELSQFVPSFTALKALELNFEANTLSILVGSSGVGKSRLLQSIAGLADYKGLRRLISPNEEVESSIEKGLLSSALYVEQFPYVLSDTLRANLHIANPNASDAQIRQALKQVNLDYLHNLDMWLGDAGRPLSGGEKKRLGIARAILTDANILLIDEPFEALDQQSIAKLCKIFTQLAENKTLILATHLIPSDLPYDQCISLEKVDGRSSELVIGNKHYE
ncbi:ATP-binding cassette domain-containing protein [Brumicola blandensis]|uniref:ATP-binding cassette domain-containing protein n=1 Tax=Brumicola blandensis TaxID=3075611 RepID=A0AAW8QWM9_9ALTE|nr:ATP-binding cassette domain-containing protein [Alteromonas sp. W409]MDT0581045.1 ATP-binding cassette domain-containing protein [Alteromonas sp. W409]